MEHLPVLYEESLQALNIQPDGLYVDCTFGRGGHSRGILAQLGEKGRLLAFDRDLTAIGSDNAQVLLEDSRFSLHHGCFSELLSVLEKLGWLGLVSGVLMDFGVSSPQLDDAGRGFSFMKQGPLDMRMDVSSGLSAAQWLAQVDESELVQVLFDYGEERFARRIAGAIVAARELSVIQSTADLVKIVEGAIPRREKHKHPATRTFQAIRIAVNNELDEVSQVLYQGATCLKSEGRLVAISFHSLEDRLVKRFIRDESGRKFNPGKLPVKEADIECGMLRKIGGAVKAGKLELQQNPRARSAVLRVAEKI